MLSRRRQKKYLAKRNEEWQQYLRAFVDSHDPEALHQLRVTLKKLKALARFAAACSGENTLKDFNGLKKMFKQAGLIRDARNHLQLLERFHPAPQGYKDLQQQVHTAETEKFIRQSKRYRRQGGRACRRLIAGIQSIPDASIRDWYALQLVSTGILLTGSSDDWHQARRQIKELLYVEKLLPSPLRTELHLDTQYLDILQDAIGQWHDAAIVVAAWAGENRESSQAMIGDAHDKEKVVRQLAETFYLRVDALPPG